MKRLILATSALSLLAPLPALAQQADVGRTRAHAVFLADDRLEGREAGTRGYDLAALYVANQFRALGIAPGDLDGDYYQPITFAKYSVDDTAENYWLLDGVRYDHGDKVLVSANPSGARGEGEAELVFVGAGLDLPEYGIDSFGDVDLAGKIAVVIYTPAVPGLPSDVGAHVAQSQSKALAARGAIGAVRVFADQMMERFPWERIKRFAGRASTNWTDENGVPFSETAALVRGGAASPEVRDLLFAGSPMDWAAIEASFLAGKPVAPFALGKSLRVVSTPKTDPAFAASNVVGMIEGSDPALKDELIVLTAHLDHVGIDEDAKPGEDRVYNGLFDNALGVASALEVARMFQDSGKAPRRSIAFVALAAEEKGLLGSDWLAHHPEQFAGKTVVGTINLDMPVVPTDFDRIVAYGAEHSTIGRQIDAALEGSGVRLVEDPQPEEAFFVRSDHYSYVKAGVPSVYLDPLPVESGQKLYDDFLETRYHKVGDDISQPVDWDAAAKFAQVNYLITRAMTDDDAPPMWYADSFFGTKMAPDAKKAQR